MYVFVAPYLLVQSSIAIRGNCPQLLRSSIADYKTQSHAIIAGPQIYVSGQIPADKEGNLIEGSIADKTKACCDNIGAILKEAGVGVERVVKVSSPIPNYLLRVCKGC